MHKEAKKIVNLMYDHDWFSQWLGIERILVEKGACTLRMKVRREMLNGFGILHGGIAFSLADSALAFAANSNGKKSVSVEASMTYIGQVKEGEVIMATAVESSVSNKIGVYHITVTSESGVKVAFFKGIVYRTGKDWLDHSS
jgi:acyl-CoA thioesterase